MDKNLDEKDKQLLRILQKEFPLSQRPFLDVAKKLQWTEDDVISRINNLLELKIIRKLGAIIDPEKIGYVSILVAVDVAEDKVEETGAIINEYPGVTHNYLREGHPNIWFTITESNKESLEKNLAEIGKRTGANIIRMPVTQKFKIGVELAI